MVDLSEEDVPDAVERPVEKKGASERKYAVVVLIVALVLLAFFLLFSVYKPAEKNVFSGQDVLTSTLQLNQTNVPTPTMPALMVPPNITLESVRVQEMPVPSAQITVVNLTWMEVRKGERVHLVALSDKPLAFWRTTLMMNKGSIQKSDFGEDIYATLYNVRLPPTMVYFWWSNNTLVLTNSTEIIPDLLSTYPPTEQLLMPSESSRN